MIVKDLTEFQSEDGKISFIEVIRATMKHGLSWKRNRAYQEDFIDSIQNILDDKCVILRSVMLPREERPIPLVLVSPAGIAVINPQRKEGVFQARDDTWSTIDGAGNLIPATPNLVQDSQFYAAAVQRYLQRHDLQDVPLESVLAFVSAGTHVDTKHPVVRVLSFDAIKNFARQISTSQLILDLKEKEHLIQLLSEPRLPSRAAPLPEFEDSQFLDTVPISALQTDTAQFKTPSSVDNIVKKLNFSKRQWLLLGGILIAEVIILVVFIFMVILAS